MGKNKTVNVKSSLGKALVRSRFSKGNREIDSSEKWLHTSNITESDDLNKINLNSVTEQTSLDDFLTTAELAGKEFESERLNIKFASSSTKIGVLNKEEKKKIKEIQEKNADLLRIPRRPFWKGTDIDAKALQLQERQSFLEWRRNLASAQENEFLSMTPFEKNLEFWRQLWRVIERSDVVVQIVDARNPLLFYCQDLEKYVKEIDENKINLLLINKSDYLTDRQRLEWLRYFEKINIRVAFWSAAVANEKTNLEKIEEYEKNLDDSGRKRLDSEMTNTSSIRDESSLIEESEEDEEEPSASAVFNKFNVLQEDEEEKSGSDTEEENNEPISEEDSKQSETETLAKTPEPKQHVPTPVPVFEKNKDEMEKKIAEMEEKLGKMNITEEERDKCRILNSADLINLFKTIHKHVVDKAKPGCTTIGLVGYPNVGKSSTINTLLKYKKVGVSETPGKTKHYQTLFIDDDLLLCDCPGLVFPSFVSTRGELILNGILPIDQMRDYVEPMNLAIDHIPRAVYEMIYGIQIKKPTEGQNQERAPTAEEVASAYAIFRSYFNHKGMPDVQRASRYILKDYVNGKLLYCYPPPGIDAYSFQDHRYETSKEVKYLEKVKKIEKQMKEKKSQLTNFDKEFFQNLEPRALSKGGIVGYHRQKALSKVDQMNPGEKPWKKHNNIKKKEKLRRLTKHFDQND
ncbi:large subunit GTPase 1 -like protein [Brachionus plicatilis]|uniref:Large subunit GTPase 1 homolog n=1 Tax=Brachionus plicatilis TaxID=10195 RepID=A0A3M7PMQ5_BRAPC|nr:large subunit GTPase 1 -like protein [Brachionus plicatilis]